MNDVKVSVYCLCYNHERYIRKALDSFVRQVTSFRFEVIVHDDASTDQSAAIIEEYAIKYPNIIKPIFQKNNQYSKGVDIVGTYIIPRIKGKYVAICEGDDYWCKRDKLQKQYDYLESHSKCSLVAHKAKTLFEKNGLILDYTEFDFSTEKKCHLSAESIIDQHTIFPTNSMFFRTEYFKKNSAILEKIRRYDYVNKILLATEGDVFVIPQVMSVYRSSSCGSWTESTSSNPQLAIQHLDYSISCLKTIDQYRNYMYHAAIKQAIKQRTFKILQLKCDIKALKSSQYINMYNELSIAHKAAIYLCGISPSTYGWIKSRIVPCYRRLEFIFNKVKQKIQRHS